MPAESAPRCRLYLITPPAVSDANVFVEQYMHALDGGDVACVQVRLKDREGVAAADDQILRLAEQIIPASQARGVAVVINDRPDLARSVGADGVHIGQSDISYAEARKILGENAIVGVTCHASRHLALEAGERGADYVAFGSFYPTETKQVSAKAEVELLEWWQAMIEIPCVAIGGITVANAAPLVNGGADFLAVSAGVWSHDAGPRAAVQQFNEIFDAHSVGPTR